MSFRINTNIEAFDAERNLQGTAMSYQQSVQRLSSGLRINSAADDAAGLSISEKMRAQINGLQQAQSNAQDGISMLQTGEGALNEVHAILQRMRELGVQAENGTLGTADEAAIGAELSQLTSEIDRIANVTNFNGTQLLNGSLNMSLQIGEGLQAFQSYETIKVSLSSAYGAQVTATGSANIGSVAGTNSLQAAVTAFVTNSASANVATATAASFTAAAVSLVYSVDQAISDISSVRSMFGAIQNRLQHSINNLSVAQENTSASESRIRDTDMAMETVNFTKAQILQQAATSILSQANQAPQGVLRLLG
jgi:flagellin